MILLVLFLFLGTDKIHPENNYFISKELGLTLKMG